MIMLLLLILIISRKRRNRYSNSDGDIEFLEVGPEPVIVYRRAAEQENKKEPEPQQQPEPPPATLPEPPESDEAELAEPSVVDQEMEEMPRPEPVLDPEPQPDSEPEAADAPEPKQQKSPDFQPLPYLESELANSTLSLLSEQGFHIEKIVYQGIYGGDFIAVRPGIRAYIQVKDWKKKITANAIAEVSSYANSHDCNQAIIVTGASYNRAATKEAARMNVSLWNQKSLKKYRKKPFFPALDEAAAARE